MQKETQALSLQMNTHIGLFIDLYLLSLSFVLFHHTLHFILSGLHFDRFSGASVRMGGAWFSICLPAAPLSFRNEIFILALRAC